MSQTNLTAENASEYMTKLGKYMSVSNNKTLVEQILASYSRLDKTTIMNRANVLIEDLSGLIGNESSVLLGNILDIVGSDANSLIELCKNEKGKKILKEIHAKYSPIFGGFKSQLADDWLRISWVNTIDVLTGEPILKIRFFKRSGEHVVLESPLSGWLSLVSHVLIQLNSAMEKTTLRADKPFIDNVNNLHHLIDGIQGRITNK